MLSPEVEANASREEQGHGGEGGEGDGKGGGVRARLCGVDVGLRPESLPVVLLLRPWNPLRDLPRPPSRPPSLTSVSISASISRRCSASPRSLPSTPSAAASRCWPSSPSGSTRAGASRSPLSAGSSRRSTSSRASARWRRARSCGASARSPSWSSPTCRATCCSCWCHSCPPRPSRWRCCSRASPSRRWTCRQGGPAGGKRAAGRPGDTAPSVRLVFYYASSSHLQARRGPPTPASACPPDETLFTCDHQAGVRRNACGER